jgi:hypothetical protein
MLPPSRAQKDATHQCCVVRLPRLRLKRVRLHFGQHAGRVTQAHNVAVRSVLLHTRAHTHTQPPAMLMPPHERALLPAPLATDEPLPSFSTMLSTAMFEAAHASTRSPATTTAAPRQGPAER